MDNISSALEAVLFASGDSIQIGRLSLMLQCEEADVIQAAEELAEAYIIRKSGIRLRRLEDRLQLCSAPEYSELVLRLLEERKAPSLSQSALEVLSIVAYYQPVTRAYIDNIRGVDSSYTVSSLCEKNLIEPCGKLDVPGRPLLYKTGENFLRVMGISTIDELPELPNLSTQEGIERLRARIDELRSNDEGNQLPIIENKTSDRDKE